eukprot:TRINITY_DN18276_c0_g1_i1.p2 TRINITY_DN18276_c0_g1~~TRINITY_DN18276_c0_g1_i1.p2  ORF type:complete len:459 (-),score=202.00 TRINITY_DN18276_c0_g1_i1:315-1691(-)
MVLEPTSPAGTASSTEAETPFFAGVYMPAAHSEVDVRFNDVDWKGLLRRETVEIVRDDVDMLKVSEGQPLDYVVGKDAEGRRYVAVLLKLLSIATADRTTQYYAVSRLKGVLSQSPEKYSRLFLSQDGAPLDPAPLLRALRVGDAAVQGVASICLALLYIHLGDGSDCEPLVSWICEQLTGGRGSSVGVRVAVGALSVLLRADGARAVFARRGGVAQLANLLRMQGGDGANAQLLYALCFCLWSLSLSEEGAYNKDFQACGAVPTLVEQVAAAPAEKVVRVALATLRNLSRGAINAFNEEMIACGLPRTLDNLRARKWGDPDVITDLDELAASLQRNYRDLTTLEAYTQEVRSGRLRWGVVHTERFWRENARATEADDFALIRALIGLLRSEDETVVAIACYDLGEFVRFYPTGKAILKHLGAKPTVMALVEHANPEVRRQALQCVSKLMVNKWEFVR